MVWGSCSLRRPRTLEKTNTKPVVDIDKYRKEIRTVYKIMRAGLSRPDFVLTHSSPSGMTGAKWLRRAVRMRQRCIRSPDIWIRPSSPPVITEVVSSPVSPSQRTGARVSPGLRIFPPIRLRIPIKRFIFLR